ncbi:transposase [Nocardia sp. NPDC050718]|uniref:RNA-guided endonuclease InsQ/TnpB family protein n=1 Tax=Nocardia sp. NPDC050718 TaxID=3155788 RepID=UPI0033E1FD2D
MERKSHVSAPRPNHRPPRYSSNVRLTKSLSRKQKGSHNRRVAAARPARHHGRIARSRYHFMHQVANLLVNTHDRMVVEDLHVSGMLRNHRMARTIADAGWANFLQTVRYKQAWRSGTIATADRFYPSSKRCSVCGSVNATLTLSDRIFRCDCGYHADRDRNAAANLAQWPSAQLDPPRSPDLRAGGRATNVRRREGADRDLAGVGETVLVEAETEILADHGMIRRRPRRAVSEHP